MKTGRNSFVVSLTVVFVLLLAACGSISEERSTAGDNQSQNNSPSLLTEDDTADTDASPAVSSLKEEYLQKLDATKKITAGWEAADSSTYALKKVEDDRWDIWDELLNEIYGVLIEQLPSGEMDQLRQEQRKWITSRDDSALAASLVYKGGTQEHLEYVMVAANLTEERCYELVEEYME